MLDGKMEWRAVSSTPLNLRGIRETVLSGTGPARCVGKID